MARRTAFVLPGQLDAQLAWYRWASQWASGMFLPQAGQTQEVDATSEVFSGAAQRHTPFARRKSWTDQSHRRPTYSVTRGGGLRNRSQGSSRGHTTSKESFEVPTLLSKQGAPKAHAHTIMEPSAAAHPEPPPPLGPTQPATPAHGRQNQLLTRTGDQDVKAVPVLPPIHLGTGAKQPPVVYPTLYPGSLVGPPKDW